MKILARITLLAVVFVVLPSLCLAQGGNRSDGPAPPPAPAIEYNPNNWKTFSSETGFTISMPGTPEYSTRQGKGPSGPVTRHIYVLTAGTGKYAVIYSDFPDSLKGQKLIEAAQDRARDNILAENKNLKLLREQKINVEGYAGRELLIQGGDIVLRWRVFFVGNRFYQLALGVSLNTAFSTGRPSSDPADFTDFYEMMSSKYFDSFRLIDSPQETMGEVDKMILSLKGKENVYGVCPTGDPLCKPVPGALTGGAINKQAVSLPQPAYPLVAKAARIKGVVEVKVILDEVGKVIAAQAISGHPLLQAAAVSAARQAQFSPTLLNGKPVKVVGVISYNFTL